MYMYSILVDFAVCTQYSIWKDTHLHNAHEFVLVQIHFTVHHIVK